jgi:DNA repair ATPase RecN
MRRVRITGVALLLCSCMAFAQRHRDPLTQPEIDKIRDTSWEPRLRLPLYVDFARARLVKLEQVRIDPKATDRLKQTHDLLSDFQSLYDELNDNIDTYVDRHDDIRKPMKTVIDADAEFQAKLRALKDAADVPPAEAQQYEFVLNNALETVDTSTEDHKKLLRDQEEQAKRKKLNKNPSAGTGVAPE